MGKILANKSVSLTELRDPAKVFAGAGDSPVAVLNRNNVVGYIVPKSAVQQVEWVYADSVEMQKIIDESIEQNRELLEYLRDK